VTAQSRTVTGKVTSADEPDGIPGVNVRVQGTTGGAITDVDGVYSVNVPQGSDVLDIRSAGFFMQEVAVCGRSVINVELEADVKILGEVVVVGYGEQSKRSVTGAISSVSGDDILNSPVQSFDQALQGKVPGVNIVTPNGVLNNRPVI